MFWEYDCLEGGALKGKNITRLFAVRRAWGQGLEDALHDSPENELARELDELVKKDIHIPIAPLGSGLTTPQFNGVVIEDIAMRKRFSKLILQIILLQYINAQETSEGAEDQIRMFYESNFKIEMNLSLMEINPMGNFPPI